MQLKKIKLAGFKSFVDPTIIHFNSMRTAVVGPNGCGKSNIIDAVRWVMGESSAKHLRGESMADVIFNGTTTRKPVGQAAIELTFDNSNTMLIGEYAKYGEIALRREVNREGFSNYYLNGGRCRRKDIVDIFLGTGLGPNSYSVIEQGMVSQLIEAKPEDLRGYLEEAAGVSKYKERRRETSNRMRHTRDNLDRLNDIREELAKQLRHLKRQANAANRYKILKQEQRLLKAQLQALHWRVVNDQLVEQEKAIKSKELELEAKLTEQSGIKAELEKLRVEHAEATDVYNEVQGRFYKIGADVGRVEQQIQHNKERCLQLEQDLQQISQSWEETEQHITTDREMIEQLSAELVELEPQEEAAKHAATQMQQKRLLTEETLNEWQYAWDSFNSDAAQSVRKAEVEQTRIEHLQQRIANEMQLVAKLSAEQDNLEFAGLEEDIVLIQKNYNQIKEKSDLFEGKLDLQHGLIVKKREENSQLLNKLAEGRNQLQKIQGRYVSLQALQQAALGKNDRSVNDWLAEHRLTDKPRLIEQIKVEKGWEKAVETVMSFHLDAICVESLEAVVGQIESFKEGHLAIFAAERGQSNGAKSSGHDRLASKITTSLPLAQLLNDVYIAADVNAAMQLRKKLGENETIITPDGFWFGKSWVRVNLAKDSQHGVLEREQEIKTLKGTLTQKEKIIAEEALKLQNGQKELIELEKALHQMQENYNKSVAEYSDVNGRLNAKQTELQHRQGRQHTIAQELEDHRQKLVLEQQQLEAVKGIWNEAEEQKLTHEAKRENLLQQKEAYRKALDQVRTEARAAQDKASQVVMRIEFVRNKVQYLTQNLERANRQIETLKERKESIASILTDTKSPLEELDRELAVALQTRLEVEDELKRAKNRLDEIDHSLRAKEVKRGEVENITAVIHRELEQFRMEWKALEVRCKTYAEQIGEAEFGLETLLSELAEEAELSEWEEKLETIGRKIERLGPINLAAIGEYEQNLERKQYLDAQNEDLMEALNTLEEAIRKIDRETKTRFKHAYERVNEEFRRLFPIVFGGGKATLEMTSDDLLNTGICITAQPPGKRNATIHLLSGGEKALTAVALVFAIFQLNPAPFCILDEVDAPLDDNNVNRFCNLVKEMSNKVQFIFVSHNKITIEMAEQLTGVTMNEPGVSRIVSVNIDQAIEMAE